MEVSELSEEVGLGLSAAKPSFPVMEFYDIGQLLDMGITMNKLSDKEKRAVLTKHAKPTGDYSFPKTTMNGANRSFQFNWFAKHPWLVYSQAKDGAYCLPCALFANKEGLGTLVNTPFRRWIKTSMVLSDHEKLIYHSTALTQADAFRTTMKHPEEAIEGYLSRQAAENVAINRHIIGAMAECVEFCGRQGIALRGHRDDATADSKTNRGNFVALVEFRAASGDTVLQNHMKKAPKNATYMSKGVQNHLIEILASQVRNQILEEVREAKFYSILADELSHRCQQTGTGSSGHSIRGCQ